jgi:hypothetical protein
MRQWDLVEKPLAIVNNENVDQDRLFKFEGFNPLMVTVIGGKLRRTPIESIVIHSPVFFVHFAANLIFLCPSIGEFSARFPGFPPEFSTPSSSSR